MMDPTPGSSRASFNEALSDPQYAFLKHIVESESGTVLSDDQKGWVEASLPALVREAQCADYASYLNKLLLADQQDGRDRLCAALTDTTTRFFSGNHQLGLFRAELEQRRGSTEPVRVWSAACSTGEEAYTLALLLDEAELSGDWSVFATDLSPKAVDAAQWGTFPISETRQVPTRFLQKHGLKNKSGAADSFTFSSELRSHLQFATHNLLRKPPPSFGVFDFIFVRNVMGAWAEKNVRIAARYLAGALKPGGALILGVNGKLPSGCEFLQLKQPSIYIRPT